jgi:hypothetical protein
MNALTCKASRGLAAVLKGRLSILVRPGKFPILGFQRSLLTYRFCRRSAVILQARLSILVRPGKFLICALS